MMTGYHGNRLLLAIAEGQLVSMGQSMAQMACMLQLKVGDCETLAAHASACHAKLANPCYVLTGQQL